MTNTCVCGCGRTLIDGYAHTDCTEQARTRLKEISELVEPARAVMYRQTATGGTVHSTPGPRDLLDLQAGARLDAVQTALTGWVRAVREDGKIKSAPRGGDLIVACAEWLANHVEVIRHLEFADEVLREIGDCWRTMRSVVATPADRERQFFGRCERTWDTSTLDEPGQEIACDGLVFGKAGRNAAYCNQCGSAYDQNELRIRAAAIVQRGHYRASQLQDAYGLNAATVRQWATRGLITARDYDQHGRPLYELSEVRAVAASEHERLDQARRKRRRPVDSVASVTPG